MTKIGSWSPPGSAFANAPSPLADYAAERAPMSGDGASGARLERLVFPDSKRLVLKEISRDWDWMMVATHDTGRAAELWISGAMDRCPPAIDPAIVRIEQTARGWRIYMRDVSDHFLRPGTLVSRAEARRFLGAFSELHAAFWNNPPAGLCSIEDLLGLVSPPMLERAVPSEHPFRAQAEAGWDVFFQIAPPDIAEIVSSILADPSELSMRLRRAGTTLVHSDPHYGNVAPLTDRLVVLDWSLAAEGPPALDFVWFLDQSARFIDASREELIDDFRAAEGERHDQQTLDLAFLAELVLNGWGMAGSQAVAKRRDQAALADFEWWIAAARRGLNVW